MPVLLEATCRQIGMTNLFIFLGYSHCPKVKAWFRREDRLDSRTVSKRIRGVIEKDTRRPTVSGEKKRLTRMKDLPVKYAPLTISTR
jgi:hypothetical protein